MHENLADIDFFPHTQTVRITIDRPTSADAIAVARELIVDTDTVDGILWETAIIDRGLDTVTATGYNVPGFIHELTIKNICADTCEEAGQQFNDGAKLLTLLGFGTHLQLSLKLTSLARATKITFDRVAA